MNNKTVIILLLGGYALCEVLRDRLSRIRVGFGGLRIIGFGGESVRMRVGVMIENPLGVSVEVNEIAGDIWIEGIECGTVDWSVKQSIKPRSRSVLQFDFDGWYERLSEALVRNIEAGDIGEMAFRFVGYVRIGEIRVKIDREMRYKELGL